MSAVSTKGRYFPYLGVGILFLIAVWGTGYWMVAVEERQNVEQAARHAEKAARDATAHSAQTFHYVDSYLKFARKEFLENGLAAVKRLLENVPLNQAIMSHITVIDENGTPLLVSGHQIKPGTTAKDRGYFKYQKTTSDDSVFISLPKVGRNSGKLLIRLVRRITRPDGGFGGVVFGAIDVGQITGFFDSLGLGPNGAVTLERSS